MPITLEATDAPRTVSTGIQPWGAAPSPAHGLTGSACSRTIDLWCPRPGGGTHEREPSDRPVTVLIRAGNRHGAGFTNTSVRYRKQPLL